MRECKHEKTEVSYGFAYSSGWKGIGGLRVCVSCFTVINFYDDYESCTEEEIEHNRKKREFNIQKKEFE